LLLYYVTDRVQFPGDASNQREALFAKLAEAARAGVDYVQLREKDLAGRALERLAADALRTIREAAPDRARTPKFLINSRTDVALAIGSDGVHLRSKDVSADVVRQVYRLCGSDTPVRHAPAGVTVAVSCHSPTEIEEAEKGGADFAVFAPVFEKKKDAPNAQPTGLAALREACRAKIPVFALGGVTLENARSCVEAGAAGIAAIRLFQDNDVGEVVRMLRGS
jgi:thiamine-phosphate pyrophosphorylase